MKGKAGKKGRRGLRKGERALLERQARQLAEITKASLDSLYDGEDLARGMRRLKRAVKKLLAEV